MDTTQLLKGVLDLAVLAVVSEEDGYGYEVLRRLRAAGLVDVGDASVYGTLRRLYAAGALTSYVVPSDEGPHRKYYGINAHGRSTLETQTKTWADFADTMNGLLRGDSVTVGPETGTGPGTGSGVSSAAGAGTLETGTLGTRTAGTAGTGTVGAGKVATEETR